MFNIAKRAIAAGDVLKATKFLNKSIVLCPLDSAKALLAELEKAPPPAPKPSSKQTSSSSPTPSSTPTPKPEPKEPVYSSDMLDAVKKVKGKSDYYAILGCSKESSESELKKSYRKLALALHPDKNTAPGSAEAFKAVGNAYAILSNKEKRARYDRYGKEDEVSSSRHQHHRHRHHNGGDEFEADITPEELFNMFFGGVAPERGRRQRFHFQTNQYTNRQQTERNDGASMISSLLQMSPLLLLILLSMLNSLFVEDPAYSFTRTTQYHEGRHTKWNNIQYFVKRDFNDKYTENKIAYYEYDIEREYKQDLQIKCFNNKRRKEQLYYQYRVTANKRYQELADGVSLTACDDYNAFRLPSHIAP